MKQNTGWIAAIGVAAAAIFGFSVLPSRNASSSPASSEGTQQKTASVRVAASPLFDSLKLPCSEIEKRILEFLPQKKLFAPEECYEKAGPRDTLTPSEDEDSPDLQFLIATLPNPVHTHFALEFDRLTDALQQAAQDQGFNYDSSWLPWIEAPRQYGSLDDQDKSEERRNFREKQPGLLVFRSALSLCHLQDANQKAQRGCDRPYHGGLLIFVVGENPTGGIDGDQFERAVAWIAALRPNGTKRNLHILSPFFSGSFPSLARLLTTEKSQAYIVTNKASIASVGGQGDLSAVEVFSGSASAQPAIEWFQKFLADRKLGQFRTFQETDDLLINRYCRLLDRQGYDTGRLAIASEDETAYGAVGANARVAQREQDNPDPALHECIKQIGEETVGPLNLYYPRDIASLRSAYSMQGGFGTGHPAQQSTQSGLPLDLSEGDSSEHDTIRSYAGEQTLLSREAALFELVNLLKAHRIEFILLRSSNALDQIFLTQFFARTYPDARVIILNSDVMFRRSSESQGFRGTMTLSTYPLLTWEQDWTFHQTPESQHSHRVFPDAGSEGLYLAVRFLIHLQNSELGLAAPIDTPLCLGPVDAVSSAPCSPQGPGVLLQDYGPPSWLLKKTIKGQEQPPTRPPTVLSVLASGQVWPVAVIDEDIVPKTPTPPLLDSRQASRAVGSAPPTASTPDHSILAPAFTRAKEHSEDLLLLPLPIRVCFSLVFVWCLWHLYCCWTGSQTGSPRCRAYFAPVPGPQHNILIFVGCLLFALLAIVMAMLTGSFAPDPYQLPFLHQLFVIVTKTLKASSPTDTDKWPSPFSHQWRMTVLYWLLLLLPLVALVANYLKIAYPRRARMRGGEKKAEEIYQKTRTDEETVRKLEEPEAQPVRGSNDSSVAAPQATPGPPESGAGLAIKIDLWAKRIHLWARTIRSWFVKKMHHYFVKWGSWLRYHPKKLALFASSFYVVVTIGLAAVFYHVLVLPSRGPTRVFVFWRAVNLFTGVSPLVPLLLLIVGMYGWFWYTLSGIALFNRDRPLLPSGDDMDRRLPMFTRERAGKNIERLAKPLSGGYGALLPMLLIGLLVPFFFFTRSDDFAIRSLGPKPYGQLFFVWLSVCVALIVTDAFQLLRIWTRLRQLLVYLDRLPLRRTLDALKGFSWGSVWKMGGSVLDQRYKLLSRQMESFRHLKNELEHLPEVAPESQPATAPAREKPDRAPTVNESFYKRLATCEASGAAFVTWYLNNYHDPHVTDVAPMEQHQEELAKTAAAVCTEILLPAWAKERHSLIQDTSHPDTKGPDTGKLELSSAPIPDYQVLAEEFFILPYLGFIQNILGRMRTLAVGMLCLFMAATISVASYPFDPRPLLGGIFLFVFVLVGTITVLVYAQMHRDTTLSHITNTNPGELGLDFWIKLVALGTGPLLALLTALFPDMASFFTSWLQPSLQAIK